jgi:hypothetical protein
MNAEFRGEIEKALASIGFTVDSRERQGRELKTWFSEPLRSRDRKRIPTALNRAGLGPVSVDSSPWWRVRGPGYSLEESESLDMTPILFLSISSSPVLREGS